MMSGKLKLFDGCLWVCLILAITVSCQKNSPKLPQKITINTPLLIERIKKQELPKLITIKKDITIDAYFNFMDSLVKRYDTVTPYPLSEHVMVRNNPWIIDTLANTDYYRMMAIDSFVYDQGKMIVLPMNSKLKVPDSIVAYTLLEAFDKTEIDINIPEYRLRIYQDSILLYSFPIRVGQNRRRYLAMGNRETDLRTLPGSGSIIKHVKEPDFYNPVDGKQFYLTKRDDGKTTLMPKIPWIETEINGVRNGQMIHPTTNPKSLEKPYSNGCIGTKEADAWVIYYHAPLGTKVKIRYDLQSYEEGSVVKIFKDIYGYAN
ncbi:L,D-transpeptidase [Maribacter sp. CXY002]|uniref:L,D-transpeptidase n=1 Tax=Maribacter luteocoastalis TaxID=3407671 RepID=UPI003B66BE84